MRPCQKRLSFPAMVGLVIAITVACAQSNRRREASVTAPPSPAAALHVEVKGHGEPVLLIPGYASSGAVWDGLVARYQGRYELHVLTLPGFAGVPRTDGPPLTAARDAIAAYVREKGLRQPALVGHSLGGVLALWLAQTEPALVGPVVVVDALPFLPAAFDPSVTPEAARARADAMRAQYLQQPAEQRLRFHRMSLQTMVTAPEHLETALGWVARSDPRTLADAMAELMTTDLRPGLARTRAPVLVLGTWVAYGDRARTEATFRAQYATLPGARVVLSETARHFVMWDDLEGLSRELDAFLPAARARVAGYDARPHP